MYSRSVLGVKAYALGNVTPREASLHTYGVDLSSHGLPCRGGCDVVFSGGAVTGSDPKAFGALCRQRVDHEKRVHAYVHKALEARKPTFSWEPTRHVDLGRLW